MGADIWSGIEASLLRIYSLPHNVVELSRRTPPMTPAAAASKSLAEIRSGLQGAPAEETFVGPKLFLRVVGSTTRGVYSGQWWFDAAILDGLEHAYSRIYFLAADRKAVIRDMLRDILAISKEWNEISEVWALELPPRGSIVGYTGFGTPQQLFSNLPLSAKGNRMLVGRARQIFFPVKNPLWVKLYERLTA
jgi:hypothetical protein